MKIIALLLFFQSVWAKTVFLAAPDKPQFNKVIELIKDESMGAYKFVRLNVDKSTSLEDFSSKVKSSKAKIMILFDNLSISLGEKYNNKAKKKIQAIGLMGLNIRKRLERNKNFCGIAYEVPAYTLLTQFRFATKKKIKNVLVFYRPEEFQQLVNTEIKLLKAEGINLNAVKVPKNAEEFLLSKGASLINDSKYDAVWVMLDSALLNKKLFPAFWIKNAMKNKTPYVVGVDKLVNPKFKFAVYGMSPDLEGIATQAVEMVDSIFGGIKCSKIGVEAVVSVKKFWNVPKADKFDIELSKDKLPGDTFLK